MVQREGAARGAPFPKVLGIQGDEVEGSPGSCIGEMDETCVSQQKVMIFKMQRYYTNVGPKWDSRLFKGCFR